MREGKIKHIPWMISMTENEGAPFGFDVIYNKTRINEVNYQWNDILPMIFMYNHVKSEYQKDHISASIRKYYLKNKPLSNQTAKHYFQALGDRHFYNGIIETAKLYSVASLGDTYCYKFYYRETAAYPDNEKNYGCLHCGDGFYILKNPSRKTKADTDMTRLLTSSIVAFMKNGNPKNPTVEVEWEPISDKGVVNCLGIYSYTVQRMEDVENHNTSRFWNDLLPPPDY
ncbi:carboxylic ester hydrolase-like [Planococcus citri]|uniref:carboxylic ester hydrolase-like n=1 Tax=Planococcus citri TaxID=170843 RepID=UPI0031FA0524